MSKKRCVCKTGIAMLDREVKRECAKVGDADTKKMLEQWCRGVRAEVKRSRRRARGKQ